VWEVYINPKNRKRILVSDSEMKRAAQRIEKTARMKPGHKGNCAIIIDGSHIFLAYKVLDDNALEVLNARYLKGRSKKKSW